MSKDQISEQFGISVANLVDGVSKIMVLPKGRKKADPSENIAKILLAMTKDIRVIVIKLSDRLHNMQSLGIMRREKRHRIAKETLEFYAPLAKRLGINTLYRELEDLSFTNLFNCRRISFW